MGTVDQLLLFFFWGRGRGGVKHAHLVPEEIGF